MFEDRKVCVCGKGVNRWVGGIQHVHVHVYIGCVMGTNFNVTHLRT